MLSRHTGESLCHTAGAHGLEAGMRRDEFTTARRERWERLDMLVGQARTGLRSMDGGEVLELGRLYRATAGDLATARRDFPDDQVTQYLNGLVARAHAVVYQGAPSGLRQLGQYVRYGFPAAFRDASPYIVLAFALFMVSGAIAAALVAVKPSLADVLLPGQAAGLRSVMAQHHLWMKSATSNHSVAANFIMINNIKVALLAFAGGMLVGLGALLVLVQNGLMLGAVGAMVARYHLSLAFWSFVVPHGVIELSVIFMSGGAGLMIGDAILRPGQLSRSSAVEKAARRAAMLLFGCIPLLVIAGTIEGFFSASNAPPAAKFALGIVAGALLYSYLLLSRPPRGTAAAYGFEDLLLDSSTTAPGL